MPFRVHSLHSSHISYLMVAISMSEPLFSSLSTSWYIGRVLLSLPRSRVHTSSSSSPSRSLAPTTTLWEELKQN